MLVCLGLGALSVQGLIGPMNGELAATLPAHMKTFGLSLYVFFQDLLQPFYVAIMGVGLQVIILCCISLCEIRTPAKRSCKYPDAPTLPPLPGVPEAGPSTSCRVFIRIRGQLQL